MEVDAAAELLPLAPALLDALGAGVVSALDDPAVGRVVSLPAPAGVEVWIVRGRSVLVAAPVLVMVV